MIRHGNPPYLECSSKGDKRFSAFYARVNGKSIEEQYQAAKVFEDGSTGLTWREAKGRRAVNMEEVSQLYSQLWDQYTDEHPELLEVLRGVSGLSDIFGQPGHVCQATELWRIRKRGEEFSIDVEPTRKSKMTEVIQGVVKWAGDQKKFGNFSFNLEDRDEWFRNENREASVVQAGNLIKIKAKKNKRGDYDVVAVKLVSEGVAGDSGNSGGSEGGIDRQSSIVMQSAQSRAIAATELLLQAGGIKLSKTKAEANKVIVVDLIDELTNKFYAAASDPASFMGDRSEVEGEEQEEEETEEPESGDDVDWD